MSDNKKTITKNDLFSVDTIKYYLEWKLKKDHFELLSVKIKDSQIIIEVRSERSNLHDFGMKAIYRVVGIDFLKQTVLVRIPAKKFHKFNKCIKQIKKEYQKQLK